MRSKNISVKPLPLETGTRGNKILRYINAYLNEHKYSPSIRDIGNACLINSTSIVKYYLERLQSFNLIEREFGISRTVRLTNSGRRIIGVEVEDICPTCHRKIDHAKEIDNDKVVCISR